MRTTIALDDDLIKTAQEYTGLVEKSALMREALKGLIEREAARRLAALRGASPAMPSIPRRRAKAKPEAKSPSPKRGSNSHILCITDDRKIPHKQTVF
jgi:Arc/MetJ family transcription regulator